MGERWNGCEDVEERRRYSLKKNRELEKSQDA